MWGIKSQIGGYLPDLKLPKLGKTVDIPVYGIYNGPDAEDYFYIFDFEEFVERSRGGVFLRPRLRVWAGRSDFARRRFGRQFRESFSKEFEAARNALSEGSTSDIGWFGQVNGLGPGVAANTAPGLIALLVLAAATSVDRVIWSALPTRSRWRKKKSDQEMLEDSITQTQAKVEVALEGMDVTLHPQLHRHAYRGVLDGPKAGMDEDAWPRPPFVAAHLRDGATTSWW